MTAESVLTSVFLEIGISKSSPNLAGSDFDVLQIKEYMNQAGEDIAKRAEWQGLYTTETVPGSVSSHTLPSDFQEIGERGSVWLNKASGTFTPLMPIIDPAMWDFAAQKPSAQLYWHIRGGEMQFSDTLDSDGAKFTYVSKNWVVGDKSAITQNSDTFLIPERLLRGLTVALWLREKGKPYDDQLAEYEANLRVDVAANRGAAA